jgi:hypothetical protein
VRSVSVGVSLQYRWRVSLQDYWREEKHERKDRSVQVLLAAKYNGAIYIEHVKIFYIPKYIQIYWLECKLACALLPGNIA